MRLSLSKSTNATSLYVVKDVYFNKKRTTKIVEKLGTEAELLEKLGGRDPYEWAKAYIAELNRLEQEGKEPDILEKYSPGNLLKKDVQRSYHGGYLFFQKIFHELGLPALCQEIGAKYKFDYDLESILSRLLYARILFPGSKLQAREVTKNFLEPPTFELHQVYRALDVLAKESDFIQQRLYQNSLKKYGRRTEVLYYDCTNFFFDIGESEGLKQYGHSKEHRPNPIVQMGLFLDADGIPLAMNITPGNQNEQRTMKPLEHQILRDFGLSKFVVSTDAGLASAENRRFNSLSNRAFITTQPLKKLKGFLIEWALDPTGWKREGSNKKWDLRTLEEEASHDLIFYKERWIKENQFEQRLVVTFSPKYKAYQRHIRTSQIDRALGIIERNPKNHKKTSPNDAKRFIQKTALTLSGEIAKKSVLTLDEGLIAKEEAFDGFYGVCTNLEDSVLEILKVNKFRWQIEACFRLLKSEFEARPVYLQRDDRILAHFITCFMALMLFKLLEKRLPEGKYTEGQILQTLSSMNFLKAKTDGFLATYTRTDLTDDLHQAFGFRTDYEILPTKKLKEIFKTSKT